MTNYVFFFLYISSGYIPSFKNFTNEIKQEQKQSDLQCVHVPSEMLHKPVPMPPNHLWMQFIMITLVYPIHSQC